MTEQVQVAESTGLQLEEGGKGDIIIPPQLLWLKAKLNCSR